MATNKPTAIGKKLLQVNDAINDLHNKLEPLRAISVVRAWCPQVLDESETHDFEETRWRNIAEVINEIKQLTE